MDQEHYRWSPLNQRPVLQWPGGAHLAFCVMIDLEYFEMDPPKHTYQSKDMAGGPGNRPYPNIPRLSHREYGHRVGVFRVLDTLAKYKIKPMVAIDAMTAEHYPFLAEYCAARQCEFIAHGIAVTQVVTSAMSSREESEYIGQTLDRIEAATGVRPNGWFGPEASESERTPSLLAAAGTRYVCDWSNDEQPYEFTVADGQLFALPTEIELDDVYALVKKGMSLRNYGRMVQDAANQLCEDGQRTGRLLVLNLHPWLIGQPFRIGVLDELLSYVMAKEDVWQTTGSEVIEWYATRNAPALG